MLNISLLGLLVVLPCFEAVPSCGQQGMSDTGSNQCHTAGTMLVQKTAIKNKGIAADEPSDEELNAFSTSFDGSCSGGGTKKFMDNINQHDASESECRQWCDTRTQCKGYEVGPDGCFWFGTLPTGGNSADAADTTCYPRYVRTSQETPPYQGRCSGVEDNKYVMDNYNENGGEQATDENCYEWCEARPHCQGFEVGRNECFWFMETPTGGNNDQEYRCYTKLSS